MKQQLTTRQLLLWRVATYFYFALPGLALASWVSRTPTIRDTLDASTSVMGWIIFGMSSGSIIGLLFASPLIARFGGRPNLVIGLSLCSLGLIVLGTGGSLIPQTILVFIGLFIFGMGNGLTDVTMNVEGTAIEHTVKKSILTSFHASFSLGTFVGALLGALALWLNLSVFVHITVIAFIVFGSALYLARFIPEGTGKETAGDEQQPTMTSKERLAIWKEPRTVMLGILVLGMAFAEGSANDWLPLIMVDGYGVTEASGSIIFGVFLAAMTIGRATGDALVNRLGRVLVLRLAALSAIIGMLIIISGVSFTAAAVGAVFWGIGAAFGFPLGLSAAGDNPRGMAVRVGAVSTTGYVAFLVGPPMLGFVGDEIGLLRALFIVLAAVLLAAVFSHAAKPTGSRHTT
ncbi:MFS transporter [Aureibacillus halotolerans]|uniref:Fucose permease n=1 Tax=Aureibacillus halotolerans TaxID=1508390 RepID=A0A4R6TTX8_9BACI|nr:MFS transporter [Aureibacillus halotolerans]TDQ36781.1 fucose permease [Aureibacillus halotolerans]